MEFREELINKFNQYISKYDITNEKILNKYYHSIRVMDQEIKYAKLLGFNEEDIKIAAINGLLHDIGRFEQIRIKITTPEKVDKDETNYSIKMLFIDGLIEYFTNKKEWYPIIKYAIENHNKIRINKENVSSRMIEQAELLRDCDKLDIILGHANSSYEIREADDSTISPEILDKFYRKEQLNKKELHTNNERLLIKFSIAFDINNDIFLPDLKEAYKTYYQRVEYNNKFKKIYEFVIEYLDERIAKNSILKQ